MLPAFIIGVGALLTVAEDHFAAKRERDPEECKVVIVTHGAGVNSSFRPN
jgi:hypothetical protein